MWTRLGRLREEHGGLAGGVASAHHDHLFAAAELRFDERRAVVDARAFELREVVDRQLAILGARRDDDGARRHRGPVVDRDGVRLPIARELAWRPSR